MTNMLDKILKENINVDVIFHKMCEEGFAAKDDTVWIVDTIEHKAFELYQDDHIMSGEIKFVKLSDDELVFTNVQKDFNELLNEVNWYESIKGEDGWMYDIRHGAVEAGEMADLYFNALYEEGNIRKNIPWLVSRGHNKSELEAMSKPELQEAFWDEWWTIY